MRSTIIKGAIGSLIATSTALTAFTAPASASPTRSTADQTAAASTAATTVRIIRGRCTAAVASNPKPTNIRFVFRPTAGHTLPANRNLRVLTFTYPDDEYQPRKRFTGNTSPAYTERQLLPTQITRITAAIVVKNAKGQTVYKFDCGDVDPRTIAGVV